MTAIYGYPHEGYFTGSLRDIDPEVHAAVTGETGRQKDGIELIASGNTGRN